MTIKYIHIQDSFTKVCMILRRRHHSCLLTKLELINKDRTRVMLLQVGRILAFFSYSWHPTDHAIIFRFESN